MDALLRSERIDPDCARAYNSAIGLPSLFKSLPNGDPFPQGTFCAFVGFAYISLYYRDAWRKLGKAVEPPGEPVRSEFPDGQSWPELRYLQIGAASSVALFVLTGAADAAHNWLDRLVGGLVGFCGAVAAAMFSLGFVCLVNLWKELILQLRKASIGSLLVPIPLAILWLAMGVGAFVGLGMAGVKLGVYVGALVRPLLWALIAFIFWGLWKGRSRAALMLRLILMATFSAIILAAAVFMYWWVSSQTAPLLVFFLAMVAFLNVLFYSRFVRDAALADNLVHTRM